MSCPYLDTTHSCLHITYFCRQQANKPVSRQRREMLCLTAMHTECVCYQNNQPLSLPRPQPLPDTAVKPA